MCLVLLLTLPLLQNTMALMAERFRAVFGRVHKYFSCRPVVLAISERKLATISLCYDDDDDDYDVDRFVSIMI